MRTPSPNSQDGRPLRADARRNYDSLVAAADLAFTEHGADASLEDIARRAGVGIGTLYRHFPTRDALLAKVLNDSVAGIVERACDLREGSSPIEALRVWLEDVLGYMTTYNGLSKSLATSLVGCKGELGNTCQALCDAGTALLARAQQAGEVRPEAEIGDIMLAINAAVWAAEQTSQPEAARRLMSILLRGLRIPPAALPAAANPPAATARSIAPHAPARPAAAHPTTRAATARPVAAPRAAAAKPTRRSTSTQRRARRHSSR